jgi:hypothetical protein
MERGSFPSFTADIIEIDINAIGNRLFNCSMMEHFVLNAISNPHSSCRNLTFSPQSPLPNHPTSTQFGGVVQRHFLTAPAAPEIKFAVISFDSLPNSNRSPVTPAYI